MRAKKVVAAVLCAAMTVELSGCGTLLYPERHGQRAGRIDPAVALLDCVGFLFYFFPGVIALGVDYATGAIYLRGGPRGADAGSPEVEVIHMASLDRASIERVVSERVGRPVSLGEAPVQAEALADRQDVYAAVATARL